MTDMIEAQGVDNLKEGLAALWLKREDVDPMDVRVGDTVRFRPVLFPGAPLGQYA